MYIGKALKRREDYRFLVGRGTFVDDVTMPDMTYAAYVRSPHAHAKIRGFGTDKARAMPGVLAVLTGQYWEDEGRGKGPVVWEITSRDGTPMKEARRSMLTADKVRYVGEAVAVVVAETLNKALDAAEAVEVDYEPLPAVVDTARALDPDVPLVHEEFGTNLCFDWEIGDEAAVEAGFAKAYHVTELVLINNRLSAGYIEPRAMMGHYDSVSEHYTLWTTSQGPHLARRWLAENSLLEPEHKIRVIAPDIGGGFGPKIFHYGEDPTILWAAKKVGRPVRWTSTRAESLAVDAHSRDHVTTCRMAFDEAGTILAIRADAIAAMGGYLSTWGPCIPSIFSYSMLPGTYTVPAAYGRVRGVYTHTAPTDAYRGAGRPETLYVVERLLENGAREMGIDVCEVRGRNLIRADQYPYTTVTGLTYDSGDPPGLLAKVKKLSGYDALRAEQAKLREDGVLMGIGLCSFMDIAGSGPSKRIQEIGSRMGFWDMSSIRVHPTGKVTVFCGSQNHGQAHATTFAQVAADGLGLDIDDIEIVEGDTDKVPFGLGTFGSRSMSVNGAAIAVGAERVIEKGRTLAAHLLECAPGDIDYGEGQFAVTGTDRKLSFAEVANAAYYGADYPEGFELGLEETVFYDPPDFNYPSAIHLAVVLVDPATGRVSLRDFSAVDDVGRIVNPMVLEGQIHGGLAQGIGQALTEHCVYDNQTGQYLSGTFMDYPIPKADHLPSFRTDNQVTLAPSHPLGIKGAGESGAIGAPAAVANAVVDALWHLGVRNIDMPITPTRVIEAIREAGG